MRIITLNGKKAAGRVALVDDEDYDLVMAYRWHLQARTPGLLYALTSILCPGTARYTSLKMNTLITGWPLTDHIDHDGLNNQRSNLRPATHAQNGANRRSVIGSSSKYKGVTWHKERRKWRAKINVGGIHRYLGLFTSEEEAALAYNAAAIAAFGPYAYLNQIEAA